MQKKDKLSCCECDRIGVIIEDKKIYCAECYLFNNNLLPVSCVQLNENININPLTLIKHFTKKK